MDPPLTKEDTSTSCTFMFFRFAFASFLILSGQFSLSFLLTYEVKSRGALPALPKPALHSSSRNKRTVERLFTGTTAQAASHPCRMATASSAERFQQLRCCRGPGAPAARPEGCPTAARQPVLQPRGGGGDPR